METKNNIASQTDVVSQADDLSSSIVNNVISVKIPYGLDRKNLEDRISSLVENMKIEQENKKIEEEILKNELLFKDKKVNDILCDLENGLSRQYIETIIKLNDLYKNNSVIKLIIDFHAWFFGVENRNYSDILDTGSSRIILGLLLHVPVNILIAMKNDTKPLEWIVEELEYYESHKSIRIDQICKNIDIRAFNNRIITDYLIINHAHLLKKYDNLPTFDDTAKKMTEMKDLLKI